MAAAENKITLATGEVITEVYHASAWNKYDYTYTHTTTADGLCVTVGRGGPVLIDYIAVRGADGALTLTLGSLPSRGVVGSVNKPDDRDIVVALARYRAGARGDAVEAIYDRSYGRR